MFTELCHKDPSVFFSVESTALRLVMGLGSWEVHPQLSRMFSESNKTSCVLISSDSEELNRALVLTLARAMHVTGGTKLCQH